MKVNLVLILASILLVLMASSQVDAAGSISCNCTCYHDAVYRYRNCRKGHKTKKYCKRIARLGECGSHCSLYFCDSDTDGSSAKPF
ncbi:hypothetical protein BJV82DRAFT_627740 [Fennellomyces sp. T-0311]|nr:hypothetical protein BJV82DRAFT_627740 [Fennellomyces sp. T-0311]